MFRKHFSSFVMLLTFAFAITSASFSQPQGRGRGFEGYLKRLKTELNLTPEQTAKVQKILNDAQKQAEQDRMKYQGDREAMFRAMRERWEKIDKEIEAVLTKEQKKKYEQIKKERQERFRGRPS